MSTQKIDEKLNIPKDQRVFPDPPRYRSSFTGLSKRWGKVDVCYGGVGITGHIAFNEPESVSIEEFSTRSTRVLDICPETRVINSVGDLHGALEMMPIQMCDYWNERNTHGKKNTFVLF